MARAFARKFYNSPAWQDVRLFVLCRDKWKCRRCDAAATEVHHRIRLTPENIHDAEIALNPDNLIALCTSCHIAQHKTDRTKGRSEKAAGLLALQFDEDGMPRPPGGTAPLGAQKTVGVAPSLELRDAHKGGVVREEE